MEVSLHGGRLKPGLTVDERTDWGHRLCPWRVSDHHRVATANGMEPECVSSLVFREYLEPYSRNCTREECDIDSCAFPPLAL